MQRRVILGFPTKTISYWRSQHTTTIVPINSFYLPTIQLIPYLGQIKAIKFVLIPN